MMSDSVEHCVDREGLEWTAEVWHGYKIFGADGGM